MASPSSPKKQDFSGEAGAIFFHLWNSSPWQSARKRELACQATVSKHAKTAAKLTCTDSCTDGGGRQTGETLRLKSHKCTVALRNLLVREKMCYLRGETSPGDSPAQLEEGRVRHCRQFSQVAKLMRLTYYEDARTCGVHDGRLTCPLLPGYQGEVYYLPAGSVALS